MNMPVGEIVWEWSEFGHFFMLEKLLQPRLVGRHHRDYRLWHKSPQHGWQPSYGGQWHYDIEGAKSRARYVVRDSYIDRVAWLEQQVNVLSRDLHLCRQELAGNGIVAQD